MCVHSPSGSVLCQGVPVLPEELKQREQHLHDDEPDHNPLCPRHGPRRPHGAPRRWECRWFTSAAMRSKSSCARQDRHGEAVLPSARQVGGPARVPGRERRGRSASRRLRYVRSQAEGPAPDRSARGSPSPPSRRTRAQFPGRNRSAGARGCARPAAGEATGDQGDAHHDLTHEAGDLSAVMRDAPHDLHRDGNLHTLLHRALHRLLKQILSGVTRHSPKEGPRCTIFTLWASPKDTASLCSARVERSNRCGSTIRSLPMSTTSTSLTHQPQRRRWSPTDTCTHIGQ